jgi:hypothetical protein
MNAQLQPLDDFECGLGRGLLVCDAMDRYGRKPQLLVDPRYANWSAKPFAQL